MGRLGALQPPKGVPRKIGPEIRKMLFLGAGMSDRDKQTAVLRFSDKLGLVTQKLADFRKRAANFRKSKFPKFDMKIGEIAILAKFCPFLGGSILAPKPMFGPDRPP